MLELTKTLLKTQDAHEVMKTLVNGGLSSLEAAQVIVKALESTAPTKSKIQMESIEVPYSEADGLAGYKAHTWEQFNAKLESVAEDTLSYRKTDFLVTWEDGFAYSGTMGVNKKNSNLGEHITAYIKKYAHVGIKKDMLKKYEINQ